MSLLPVGRREEHHALWPLQTELNRLFEDFFGNGFPWRGRRGEAGEDFLPAVDVRETEDKVIIEAELPGVDAHAVDVRLEDGCLLIGGERKHESDEKTRGYRRVERSYGRFQRQLDLPPGTDPNRVEATYKDGILTVEIGKKEEAKPKTISVKVKT